MDVLQTKTPRELDITSSTTLCDLPDEVLHQILSLLPTRDAVRISMASKRLESLRRSIPKLGFHRTKCQGESERRLFMDFVDRSLRLRDEGSSITQFSLSCWLKCSDASRVREWLSDVVLRHSVQELCLHLSPEPLNPIEFLPSCVFRSEKLRKLHLRGLGVLPIPPQVCLQNLKDLSLKGVALLGHELIEKLLSSPSLERLSIEGCNLEISWKPITVSAPKLNSLSILYSICPDLAIHASNLKHIFYRGELDKRFVISGSPVLDKVVIATSDSTDTAVMLSNLLKLLQDTSGVKNELTLSTGVLSRLLKQNHHSDFMPVFPNVKKLKLTSGPPYYVSSLNLGTLCSLLRRCPSIETLEFHDVGLFGTPVGRDEHLLMANLKKIAVDSSIECDKMLLGVGFWLMRAPVLDVLVLKCPWHRPVQRELFYRLLKLPRISKCCGLRIIP